MLPVTGSCQLRMTATALPNKVCIYANKLGRHLGKGAAPNQHPPPPVVGVKCDPAAAAAVVDADAVVQWLPAAAAAAGCTTAAAAAAAVGELQCFGCSHRRYQPPPLAVRLRNSCVWLFASSAASLPFCPFIARPGVKAVCSGHLVSRNNTKLGRSCPVNLAKVSQDYCAPNAIASTATASTGIAMHIARRPGA